MRTYVPRWPVYDQRRAPSVHRDDADSGISHLRRRSGPSAVARGADLR